LRDLAAEVKAGITTFKVSSYMREDPLLQAARATMEEENRKTKDLEKRAAELRDEVKVRQSMMRLVEADQAQARSACASTPAAGQLGAGQEPSGKDPEAATDEHMKLELVRVLRGVREKQCELGLLRQQMEAAETSRQELQRGRQELQGNILGAVEGLLGEDAGAAAEVAMTALNSSRAIPPSGWKQRLEEAWQLVERHPEVYARFECPTAFQPSASQAEVQPQEAEDITELLAQTWPLSRPRLPSKGREASDARRARSRAAAVRTLKESDRGLWRCAGEVEQLLHFNQEVQGASAGEEEDEGQLSDLSAEEDEAEGSSATTASRQRMLFIEEQNAGIAVEVARLCHEIATVHEHRETLQAEQASIVKGVRSTKQHASTKVPPTKKQPG